MKQLLAKLALIDRGNVLKAIYQKEKDPLKSCPKFIVLTEFISNNDLWDTSLGRWANDEFYSRGR